MLILRLSYDTTHLLGYFFTMKTTTTELNLIELSCVVCFVVRGNVAFVAISFL